MGYLQDSVLKHLSPQSPPLTRDKCLFAAFECCLSALEDGLLFHARFGCDIHEREEEVGLGADTDMQEAVTA